MNKIKLLSNILYLSTSTIKNIPKYISKFTDDIIKGLEYAEKCARHSYTTKNFDLMYTAAKEIEECNPEGTSKVIRKLALGIANYCSNENKLKNYIDTLINEVQCLSEESNYFDEKQVEFTINFLKKLKKDDEMIDEISYYLSLPTESLKELRDIEERERSLLELKKLEKYKK